MVKLPKVRSVLTGIFLKSDGIRKKCWNSSIGNRPADQVMVKMKHDSAAARRYAFVASPLESNWVRPEVGLAKGFAGRSFRRAE
jgi:hypothetical protein